MPTFQTWKKPPQFSQSFKDCTNPCYKKLMTVGINAWPVTHGILNLKDDNHKMKAKQGAARVSRKHPQLPPIQSFSKHPLIERNQLGIQDGFLGLLLLLLLLLLLRKLLLNLGWGLLALGLRGHLVVAEVGRVLVGGHSPHVLLLARGWLLDGLLAGVGVHPPRLGLLLWEILRHTCSQTMPLRWDLMHANSQQNFSSKTHLHDRITCLWCKHTSDIFSLFVVVVVVEQTVVSSCQKERILHNTYKS